MEELHFEKKYDKPICLALGFFDSVHLGHREIIERLKESARFHCAQSCIFTFSNNAYKQFNPDGKLIYTLQERMSIFDSLGIELLLPVNFNKDFKNLTRDEFLLALSSHFNIKAFICGYDYLFGKGGEGNAEYLAAYARKNNIFCDVVQPIAHKNLRVSTSYIKNLLSNGDIVQANSFLGQNYFMQGTVTRGRGVGHLYGIPTANLSFFKEKHLIMSGVYATNTFIEGKKYKSVTNVGDKPTFDEPTFSVETLLQGFDGNLYDSEITIEFVKKIRPIHKFDSPEELVKQIKRDLCWSQGGE